MPPIASFTVNTSFFTVSVNASASMSDVAITSYDWDWGDLTTGTGEITTHTYTTQGVYTITLTITDSNGLTDFTTWDVDIAVIENQYRYAMELLQNPFSIPLNPGPVHDHDSVYIYRILPLPTTIELTFLTSGLSYVEVFDADNQRFLLPEKTAISQNATFVIEWDGKGVFEVRVWKNSFVTDIDFAFTLPDDQIIHEITPSITTAQLALATGIIVASVAGFVTVAKRGKKDD